MIDVIGVPCDLSGMRNGSRLGPAAIRLAGLHNTFNSLGLDYCDHGDLPLPDEATSEGGMHNFPAALCAIKTLRARTLESLASGSVPLVLGGEHTMSVATVSAALTHCTGDLGVLWIDAHADLNTPGSTLTGNMHGMPLAALWGVASETTGQQDKEWKELIEVVGQYKLRKHGTAWLGLRDVDPGECVHMGEPMLCLPMTMQDVDRRGIAGCMQTFDRWMWEKGIRNLWISFDVDSLDPILAPGTGTAVRGGLSYREGHLLAELLCELLAMKDCPYKLVGVDVVETNPIYDTNNATAIVAVEWIASLFGKTILGKR